MALAHAAARHAQGLPPERQRRAAQGLERLMERMLPAARAVLLVVDSAEPELQRVLQRTLLRPEPMCTYVQQAAEVLQFVDSAVTGACWPSACTGFSSRPIGTLLCTVQARQDTFALGIPSGSPWQPSSAPEAACWGQVFPGVLE